MLSSFPYTKQTAVWTLRAKDPSSYPPSPPFPPSRLPFSQFTSLYHTKRTAAQKGERRRDTKQGRFRLTVTPPLSCFGRLSLPPSLSLFAGPSALPLSSSWNIACSPLLFLIRLPAAAAEQTGLSLSIPAIPLFHFRSLSEARHIFGFFSLPFLDPISSGERAADVANPPLPPPSVPQPLSVQNSGRHCRIIAPPPFESAPLRHKAINWQYVLLLLLSLPCGADWRSLHPIIPRSQNWEDGGTIRARGVCTITVQCPLLSTLFSCFAVVVYVLYCRPPPPPPDLLAIPQGH